MDKLGARGAPAWGGSSNPYSAAHTQLPSCKQRWQEMDQSKAAMTVLRDMLGTGDKDVPGYAEGAASHGASAQSSTTYTPMRSRRNSLSGPGFLTPTLDIASASRTPFGLSGPASPMRPPMAPELDVGAVLFPESAALPRSARGSRAGSRAGSRQVSRGLSPLQEGSPEGQITPYRNTAPRSDLAAVTEEGVFSASDFLRVARQEVMKAQNEALDTALGFAPKEAMAKPETPGTEEQKVHIRLMAGRNDKTVRVVVAVLPKGAACHWPPGPDDPEAMEDINFNCGTVIHNICRIMFGCK